MPLTRTGRVVLVAFVGWLLPLVGNVVASFLTDWTGLGAWLAGPAVALVAAIAAALFGASADDSSARDPGRAPPTGPRPRSGRPQPAGRGLGSVLLVALAVVAVGAVVTLGVRYVIGFVSGDESGVSVLVQDEVEGGGAGVALTVQDVVYTPNFTRVTVLAVNGNAASVTLPVFGNCVLVGDDGSTLQADSFRGDWTPTLPPGSRQRGTLVFPGRLPDTATGASLSFATVFVQGPGSGAATVDGLELDPGRLTAPQALAPRALAPPE